jgi:hypothetical protein
VAWAPRPPDGSVACQCADIDFDFAAGLDLALYRLSLAGSPGAAPRPGGTPALRRRRRRRRVRHPRRRGGSARRRDSPRAGARAPLSGRRARRRGVRRHDRLRREPRHGRRPGRDARRRNRARAAARLYTSLGSVGGLRGAAPRAGLGHLAHRRLRARELAAVRPADALSRQRSDGGAGSQRVRADAPRASDPRRGGRDRAGRGVLWAVRGVQPRPDPGRGRDPGWSRSRGARRGGGRRGGGGAERRGGQGRLREQQRLVLLLLAAAWWDRGTEFVWSHRRRRGPPRPSVRRRRHFGRRSGRNRTDRHARRSRRAGPERERDAGLAWRAGHFGREWRRGRCIPRGVALRSARRGRWQRRARIPGNGGGGGGGEAAATTPATATAPPAVGGGGGCRAPARRRGVGRGSIALYLWQSSAVLVDSLLLSATAASRQRRSRGCWGSRWLSRTGWTLWRQQRAGRRGQRRSRRRRRERRDRRQWRQWRGRPLRGTGLRRRREPPARLREHLLAGCAGRGWRGTEPWCRGHSARAPRLLSARQRGFS